MPSSLMASHGLTQRLGLRRERCQQIEKSNRVSSKWRLGRSGCKQWGHAEDVNDAHDSSAAHHISNADAKKRIPPDISTAAKPQADTSATPIGTNQIDW